MDAQHPIPQQISSYKFKLVGDMTLTQFFKVAGGVGVALILYASGLPGIIRWPLMLISAGLGAAMAFVPLGGRPLEKWVMAFLRSIYTPTTFVWAHDEGVAYFQNEAPIPTQPVAAPIILHTQLQPTVQPTTTPPIQQPGRIISQVTEVSTPAPITQVTPVKDEIEIPEEEIVETTSSNKLESAEKSYLARITKGFSMPTLSKFARQKTDKPDVPIEEVKTVTIPDSTFVTVAPVNAPLPKSEPEKINIDDLPDVTTKLEPIVGGESKLPVDEAIFSQSAAPPVAPDRPNIVVGQVIDASSRIVESAILEIRDSEGRPMRAFKTNQLGHFTIATPLPSGQYSIVTEKEGLVFDPVTFEARGEIIDPIAIKAKAN